MFNTREINKLWYIHTLRYYTSCKLINETCIHQHSKRGKHKDDNKKTASDVTDRAEVGLQFIWKIIQ